FSGFFSIDTNLPLALLEDEVHKIYPPFPLYDGLIQYESGYEALRAKLTYFDAKYLDEAFHKHLAKMAGNRVQYGIQADETIRGSFCAALRVKVEADLRTLKGLEPVTEKAQPSPYPSFVRSCIECH